MSRQGHRLDTLVFILALISTILLAFIMLALPAYRAEIFLEREILSNAEILIAAGFGSMLLFNLVSGRWLLSGMLGGKKTAADIVLLVLAAICTVLLLGEKTMIDEIGKESLQGWEARGEWVILYGFLTTQLVFNLAVLLKTFRAHRAQVFESRPRLC